MVARRFLGPKTVLQTVLRYDAFGTNTNTRARPMWLVGEPGSKANMALTVMARPWHCDGTRMTPGCRSRGDVMAFTWHCDGTPVAQ